MKDELVRYAPCSSS